MKYSTIILFMLLSIGCNHIPIEKQRVLARETTLMANLYKDYGQTIEISRNPDKYHEINPVLGKHPHENKVQAYFLFRGLSHLAVSYFINEKYATIWQSAFFIPSIYMTEKNDRISLKHDININFYVSKTFEF